MEDRSKLKHEVFEIIDTTYRAVFPEGHVRIQKEDDVINNKELVFWCAADVDEDPNTDIVIFGSERFLNGKSLGYKISGWGHDGSREGKRVLIQQLAALLKDEGKNVWIEVAGSPAQILTHHNFNINRVPKEKVQEIFFDSEFEWIEGEEDFEGFYIRHLSDGIKTDKEILLGNPNL
jgi:hypothetical protein